MTAEGLLIREARTRYDLSQEALGQLVGYDRSMIANMELGRRSVPEDFF